MARVKRPYPDRLEDHQPPAYALRVAYTPTGSRGHLPGCAPTQGYAPRPPMRITVTDASLMPDLLSFLRKEGCVAYYEGGGSRPYDRTPSASKRRQSYAACCTSGATNTPKRRSRCPSKTDHSAKGCVSRTRSCPGSEVGPARTPAGRRPAVDARAAYGSNASSVPSPESSPPTRLRTIARSSHDQLLNFYPLFEGTIRNRLDPEVVVIGELPWTADGDGRLTRGDSSSRVPGPRCTRRRLLFCGCRGRNTATGCHSAMQGRHLQLLATSL